MSSGLPVLLALAGGWVVAIVVFAVIAIGVGGIVVLIYGKLWFQAYMSTHGSSLLSLIGMSFRQVNARTIVQAKIMAMQAGVGNGSRNGHHHAATRGPLPGRRQRAERDPRHHRRAPGRHRPGLRPRGGDRPGRPRRARRRADERLSQGDRLPRSGKVEANDARAPSPRTASN